MPRDPDFARNANALAAVYFGWTAMYALDPVATSGKTVAIAFALIGLWFALAAAFDLLGKASADAV